MRAHVLRGQGGWWTSPGMDDLGTEISKLGCTTRVWNWRDWQEVTRDINANGGPTMIIGYSMGGNAATWILGGVQGVPGVHHPVALAVFMDPTTYSVVTPLTGNIQRAVLFRGTNPFSIVGGADVTRGPNFHGSYLARTTGVWHIWVQVDGPIRSMILGEVSMALRGPLVRVP